MNKIRLLNIFPCEQIITSEQGNVSIINIFDTINASSLPAVHPLLLINVWFQGEVGSYNGSVKILDSEKNKIGESNGTMTIPEENKTGRHNLRARFHNVVFEKSGKYFIEVEIDGKKITDSDSDYFFVEVNG